jgi:hypothetical protein
MWICATAMVPWPSGVPPSYLSTNLSCKHTYSTRSALITPYGSFVMRDLSPKNCSRMMYTHKRIHTENPTRTLTHTRNKHTHTHKHIHPPHTHTQNRPLYTGNLGKSCSSLSPAMNATFCEVVLRFFLSLNFFENMMIQQPIEAYQFFVEI